MSNPNLTEQGVKYWLKETLKVNNAQRKKAFSFRINVYATVFFLAVVAFLIWNKKDRSLSDDEKKMDEKVPILSALGRTIRYHLGSVAFGSCIIALVQLARAIMFYIDQQTKGLQGKSCILMILMKIVYKNAILILNGIIKKKKKNHIYIG